MTHAVAARDPRDVPEVFAVITGGGTAGHVQPALAIGEALVAKGRDPRTIRYVGSQRGMEARLVPEAGFQVTLLPGRGIQRRLTVQNLRAIGGLVVACLRAVELLARWRPRVVVTVGGFAGFPCSLAAVLLRVPLVVVNVDAVPGASNRLAAHFARVCAVAFPDTQLPRTVVTGAPVRAAVLAARRTAEGREEARRALGLPAERSVVVVAGGSLGARRLNEAALGLASSWAARSDVTLYHVAGERNLAAIEQAASELGIVRGPARGDGLDYRLVGYESRLPQLLAACDLAVCRAGASTVAELAAIGTPAILVPLPGAPGDHQTRNARALSQVGAAELVVDGECSAPQLEALLASLLGDRDRLEAIAQAAARAGRRDAAQRVAVLAESSAEFAR